MTPQSGDLIQRCQGWLPGERSTRSPPRASTPAEQPPGCAVARHSGHRPQPYRHPDLALIVRSDIHNIDPFFEIFSKKVYLAYFELRELPLKLAIVQSVRDRIFASRGTSPSLGNDHQRVTSEQSHGEICINREHQLAWEPHQTARESLVWQLQTASRIAIVDNAVPAIF